MAQVNSPNTQRDDDILGTLAKGLGIASQIYGIRANMAQLDGYQKKREAEQNLSQGKYDKNQQVMLSKEFDVSESQPATGGYKQISDASTGSPLYLSAKRKEQGPLVEKVATVKNGLPGTAFVDVNSQKELAFYPSAKEVKAPEPVRTREIETVDARGNPIRRIVEDKPGQEFTAVPRADQKLSKEQFDAATYGKRMVAANQIFDNLTAQGFNRASRFEGVKSVILPESSKSSPLKQQDQAERNFINAVLRRESGAAISPAEFENASLQYFPRAGEDSEVLAQKAQNRQQAIEGLVAAAGNAWEKVKDVPLAKTKQDTSGQAMAAPAQQSGPSAIELLKSKAAAGDKKAQDYLNSINRGQ